MPPDFRFIVDAAQRHADEFAIEGASNRFPKRGLPHTRRSYEAEDRPFELRSQLQDRQIIQNSFLNFFDIVVVFLKDRLRLAEIHFKAAQLAPGQRHQPVQIRARDVIVCRHGRHLGEPAELAQRLFARFLAHASGLDFLAQLFDLLLLVGFTELLLNRFHLLAQIVLSLALRHLVLNVGLNFRAELEHFDLSCELMIQPLEA